jgi:uncharacterized protein YegJ (DUF2314 family)
MRTPTVIAIGALLLIAIAIGGWAVWRSWKRPTEPAVRERAEDQPMVSLVYLLRQPRALDAEDLTSIVSRAWNVDFNRESGTRFVVGEPPGFIVKDDAWFFMVHVWNIPYVGQNEDALQGIRELRLRKAFREHKAWIAVDLLHGPEGGDSETIAYRRIGTLMAELAGDDCIALFMPETSRLVDWNNELIQILRSPDPTSLLNEVVGVYEIESDNPELRAAEKEARERWPEFFEAFETRRDDQFFSVKAPLTDGDQTEFIWIDVTAIENDVVLGTLGNDPVDLPSYRYKDKVRVRVADVSDWLYLDNGKIVGGFTRHLFGY